MFEHHRQPVIPFDKFIRRVFRGAGVLLILLFVSLLVGMTGYHKLESMDWVEAFYNAALIMSGMGPANDLNTTAGKIFASIYSIYSGLFLVAATGLLLMPFFHRVLHTFHHEESGR
ncbi:MAG: hypothetical protein V4628_15805 [Pseudomonadota bacterium]